MWNGVCLLNIGLIIKFLMFKIIGLVRKNNIM